MWSYLILSTRTHLIYLDSLISDPVLVSDTGGTLLDFYLSLFGLTSVCGVLL